MWILAQMLIYMIVGYVVAEGPGILFRRQLAVCGYICFFTGVPAVLTRHIFKTKARTGYVRASILLFFPTVAVSADFFQYFFAPGRVFDGTFSAYHILNPFRALSNWPKVEELGWQWGTIVMGLIGIIAYLELYRMGRLEDKHAANPS